jgi:RNA polymerase sigma-70 factor (ECF subfamily)
VVNDDLGENRDRALVAAIAGGDDDAMAEVVRLHRAPVIAFARRLVGDGARAEEISQEVFLRLWERSDRFDAKRGSLRTFLLAMTHGKALDVVRSDASRRGREAREVQGTDAVSQPVEREIVERTVAEALRAALAQLPDGERRAVELAYFGGHSYRAVAELLGEPEGTVKSRIRNGLSRLRAVLEEQELNGP